MNPESNPQIFLPAPERHNGWTTKLGRVAAVLTLAASSYGIGAMERGHDYDSLKNIEMLGAGDYENSLLADTATNLAGSIGGECREFVNNIVWQVSHGHQNIASHRENYFQAFYDVGAQEITDINNLSKGDIVQQGQTEKENIHTFIIVKREHDDIFDIVDSNSVEYHKVGEHSRSVHLDSKVRAFRLGRVATKPAFDPSKFKGHIVQWDDGPEKPHVSWLVGPDLRRHWIPNASTYWCLRNRGAIDDGVEPSSVLDALPDSNGDWATCNNNTRFDVAPPYVQPQYINPITPEYTPAQPAPEVYYPPADQGNPAPQPTNQGEQAPPPTEQPTSEPQPANSTEPSSEPTPVRDNTPPPPPEPATRKTYTEQEGHHGANTFSNYHNASGYGPRKVNPGEYVEVECKVYDPTIQSASPDGYWYRIASSPWDDQYYAVANTFMNGDPWNGPYTHNTDFNVPDC